MTLQISRLQAIPLHQREEQGHGTGHINLAGGPAAYGALRHPEEGGAANLRQTQSVEGGAEVVGGHLGALHVEAVDKLDGILQGQAGMQDMDVAIAARPALAVYGVAGDADVEEARRRLGADAQAGADPRGERRPLQVDHRGRQAHGARTGLGLLKLRGRQVGGFGVGHFNLQRAPALPNDQTIPDKMSGRQAVIA